MEYNLDFYTAYNQFYISSDGGEGLIDPSKNMLSKSTVRLVELKDTIIVRTESYGHINGKFVELNTENKHIDLEKYDHVVESSIEVKAGSIQILDCPNSSVEFEIKVNPGIYAIRIYFSNMTGFDTDEDEGSEHYTIEIWAITERRTKIIKEFKL